MPSSRAWTATASAVVGTSAATTDAGVTFGASGSAGMDLSSSARAAMTLVWRRRVIALLARSESANLTAEAVSARNFATAATNACLFAAIVIFLILGRAGRPWGPVCRLTDRGL